MAQTSKYLYIKKSFQCIVFTSVFQSHVALLVSDWKKATFILFTNKHNFIRVRIIQITSFPIKA
jgi:hypothetical protein